jgi:hypothetical protein
MGLSHYLNLMAVTGYMSGGRADSVRRLSTPNKPRPLVSMARYSLYRRRPGNDSSTLTLTAFDAHAHASARATADP